MHLEIITPTKKLYADEVSLVKLPGTSGSFEILENHAPIVSTLEKGNIKVIDRHRETHFFNITGGVVECRSNKITVLADGIVANAE
ncbi:ATP synthase F1 subunit epsilon [Roseimarinus sediminis]|uniref:ATP synthase F1 subunit epsilon n=1 Tax=Roseimarinus sediminis TaxID=1610899 RepID=UPI003D1A9691